MLAEAFNFIIFHVSDEPVEINKKTLLVGYRKDSELLYLKCT